MDALRGSADGPVTTAELAGRADFTLGEALVSPAARTITGPDGSVGVEPRVMQVLLVLADADGAVVARETLFRRCWGDIYVGDDSLNRVIHALRKLAAGIARSSFEIETIPRTGYRLKCTGAAARVETAEVKAGVSRRLLIGGGIAASAALAGSGLWWVASNRSEPHFDALIQRGAAALRFGSPRSDGQAARYFEEAVALRPEDANAWGLLAYARVAASESGPRAQAGEKVQAAEHAARAALALNPAQADALTALVLIESPIKHRAAIEEGLSKVLAIAPTNPWAMAWMSRLLQGAGRCRESWQWSERRIAAEPISPLHFQSRAMKLWTLGRMEEAQRVSRSGLDLWPSHGFVRMARLMICAFTGREREALALVDEEEARPVLLTPQGVSIWRASLAAIETRSAAAVEAAREASLDGARRSPALAAYALLVMAELGELDAAFDIANGFLLSRGPVVVQRRATSDTWLDAPGWRNTLGLFVPPAKAMRLDPRFGPLCDRLGLTDYWRERGIGPDAFLMQA